jgi:hypothetical protein
MVFGFGQENAPASFRQKCDRFVVLPSAKSKVQKKSGETSSIPPNPPVPERHLVKVIEIAAQTYPEVDGWTLVSRAGTMIKQQFPAFSIQSYGCRTLSSLISRLGSRFEVAKQPRGKGITALYRVCAH